MDLKTNSFELYDSFTDESSIDSYLEKNIEANSSYINNDGILLQPFLHQVGGHLCMLKCDNNTICKPLQIKEKEFYKYQVPNILKPYLAKYYGLVDVYLQIDKHGYVDLIIPKKLTSYQNSLHDPQESKNNKSTKKRFKPENCLSLPEKFSTIKVRIKYTGSLEVLDPLHLNLFEKVDLHSLPKSHFSHNSNKAKKTYSFNPWSLKRHREQVLTMQKDKQSIYKFIRLQDLTAQFSYPCVLDLKMGTRQYGDDASEQKKISQIAKCQSSTSSSLGVRICGMQVYQFQNEVFMCYDKYIGRKLSPQGFEESLRLFFQPALSSLHHSHHDASPLPQSPPQDSTDSFIIGHECLATSSHQPHDHHLLTPDNTSNDKLYYSESPDFTNPNFNHTFLDLSFPSPSSSTVVTEKGKNGRDVVNGSGIDPDVSSNDADIVQTVLDQLIQLRAAISTLHNYRFYSSSLLILYEGGPNPRQVSRPHKTAYNNNDTISTNNNEGQCSRQSLAKVYMVDFAHSSSGYVKSSEPDTGYLFGLDNLIQIVTEIRSTCPS